MTVHLRDEIGEVWVVPVAELLSSWDPFSAWMDDPVTADEIAEAIDEGRLDPRCYDTLSIGPDDADFRRYHVERIAWLVENPDHTPISIDVGAPSLGWHPRHGGFDFIDGNHRLCAAAYRGDWGILVSYSGECDAMFHLFPEGRIFDSDQ